MHAGHNWFVNFRCKIQLDQAVHVHSFDAERQRQKFTSECNLPLPSLHPTKIGTSKGAHARAHSYHTRHNNCPLVRLMASAGDVGRVNEPDPCVEIATLAVVHVLLMSEVMCVRIC